MRNRRPWTIYVCDKCDDNPVAPPGELCEVCNEGIVDAVEVVEASHLRAVEGALSDLLSEFDELADAYSALKKRHEPPYVNYASWAKPAALAALSSSSAGSGGRP